jgi:hypothetical protein
LNGIAAGELRQRRADIGQSVGMQRNRNGQQNEK